MEKSIVTRFFLGANSRYGFYSLYDNFTDPAAGDFLWVIKGGPGCGKSSFMKKIGAAAESAGLSVEYIHCSGDPVSLDAVWLPELRQGYVDGTAPHLIEAAYPAAASMYLDLGAFYDSEALKRELPAIVDLTRRYKLYYQRAYDCLAAAAYIAPSDYPELLGSRELEKIRKKALGIAAREFTHAAEHPRRRQRFLSAISCQGRVFCRESVESLCQRVYTLDNEFGLAPCYLRELDKLAQENRQDYIYCPDPLDPNKAEALIFPQQSLAFLAVDRQKPYLGEVYRHVRLDALIHRESAAALRPTFRSARKTGIQAQHEAIAALSQAKELHDRLEAIYNPHVDFNGIYALAQQHIHRLLTATGEKGSE